MFFDKPTGRIPRRLRLAAAALLALILAFILYVRAEKQIDRANEQRQHTILLADQLRQSSDDLTRMARAYVITGDPLYKRYYQDILDIRNGAKPRPEGYLHVYWDLVLANPQTPRPEGGKTVPLLDLIHQTGLAEEEFASLVRAKKNSDFLSMIEQEAMGLAERPGAAENRERAITMMHDARYLQAKAEVMKPINHALEMIDKRTAAQVSATERNAIWSRLFYIVCVSITVLFLWRAYVALRATLGGSAREIHAYIRRIGEGDLSSFIPVTPAMKGSVLAGLADMQAKLRGSELRQNAIFAASPDAMLISDARGRIIQVNHQVERLLGYTTDELIGQTIDMLVPLPQRAAHPELRAGFAAAPIARRMGEGLSVKALKKDGGEVDVEISLSRIDAEQGALFVSAMRDITERKQQEERIRSLLSENQTILNNAVVGIVHLKQRHIVSCNRRFEEIFQYAPGELIGASSAVLYDTPATFEKIGAEAYGAEAARNGYTTEVRLRHKDGSLFWGQLTGRAIDSDRPHEGSIWIYSDITDLKQAADALRIAATAFESQEGMIITNADGVILSINSAFTETTGYTAEDIVGQTPRLLKSGRHGPEFYRRMWDTISSTGKWQGEIWDRRKNGEIYPKWLTISAVKGEDGAVTHYVGTHFDISERKKAEQKIEELAFFDQLTGLPNRTLLLDRLKQAMTASNRHGNFGAVLFIDLDHFKTLNDTLGHDKGDQLLSQVAQRLAASVREEDTVARLGGDEFVVVLGSLNGNAEEAASQTETVGGKILAALNQPYQLGGVAHRSSASIGATLFRGHETTIEDILKQADLAMYKSKDTGRNALRFFDPAMQTVVMERVVLEEQIREALTARQFQLYYQAQVLDGPRVVGAEALLRWRHPRRGMVPPADFIPLAEETGLILPLGQWVLETACQQLACWAKRPEMAHLTVAVNVSAHQFRHPDFVDQVLTALDDAGANPGLLKLELTESMLVSNVDEIVEKMFALRAKGVGFALDDFGTGFSSLSYLKRLPLDQLKIDQSFVRDVLSDPNDAAIARTVITLAKSLGLGVIAEGVETEAQRAFLASAGCHAYQGYFFSHPLPLDDFEAFARQP